MDKGRVITCDKCSKELEVRWGIFAHSTLARHMRESLWFLFGLFLGLGLDFILVLHMLKPIKNRLDKLDKK